MNSDDRGAGFNRTIPRLERAAMVRARQGTYLRRLKARGRRSADPDFSQCSNTDECEIVRLCGDIGVWREISTNEPQEQERAEGALAAALVFLGGAEPGAMRSLGTERDRRSEDPEPPVTPEIAEKLRKLGLDPEFAACRTESDMRAVQERRAAEKATK